jgi:hypothetical protein
MKYINQKGIKTFLHSKGKRISKTALEQLDSKIHRILVNSIELSKSFKTIKPIEIEHARG